MIETESGQPGSFRTFRPINPQLCGQIERNPSKLSIFCIYTLAIIEKYDKVSRS